MRNKYRGGHAYAVSAALCLIAAMPLQGQSTPAPSAVPAVVAPKAVVIDPARLAEATRTAAFLIPDGVYEKVLATTFSEMMPQMFGMVGGMKMDALPGGDKAGGNDATLRENLLKTDPNFEERMTITMKVMGEKMAPLMRKLEPKLREGMAKSYARKFTVPQLQAMNVFFASPAGKAYADNYLVVMSDKEAMAATIEFMPELITVMMGIEGDVKKATAHLPPLPAIVETDVAVADGGFDGLPECTLDDDSSDCSPEDRAKADKFYASIGLDLAKQEKEIAAQKKATADFEARQAKLRAAWNAKDRAAIERLEKSAFAQQAKAETEYNKVSNLQAKIDEAKRQARVKAGQPEEEEQPPYLGDEVEGVPEPSAGFATDAVKATKP